MWEGKFCQVCYLVGLTSQQVVWDEQERQDYTAEGEAIGSVMVWSVMGEPGFDPETFNSTDDTAATSVWLPIRHRLHPTPEHADACAASGNYYPVGQCDCTDADRYEAVLDWWDAAYGPRLTTPALP